MKIYLGLTITTAIFAAVLSTSFKPEYLIQRAQENVGIANNALDGYAATPSEVEIVYFDSSADYIEHLMSVTPASCEIGHDYLSSALITYKDVAFNLRVEKSLNKAVTKICNY